MPVSLDRLVYLYVFMAETLLGLIIGIFEYVLRGELA
jgi:hypothetical protein